MMRLKIKWEKRDKIKRVIIGISREKKNDFFYLIMIKLRDEGSWIFTYWNNVRHENERVWSKVSDEWGWAEIKKVEKLKQIGNRNMEKMLRWIMMSFMELRKFNVNRWR